MPEPGTSVVNPLPNADIRAALPALRRYATLLTHDSHGAEDLVQDTLARAWEKRRLWRAGSNLRAWLFTIMHNLHLNQFAKRRRDLACESLEAAEGATESVTRATQLEHVALAEVIAEVSRLPREQREVLMLAAVEELRYEEIAAVLDIPVGTVMSRLSRARERLRRAMSAGSRDESKRRPE
jgi:RNA polymerase sigma-70 factor (ECF subfamily)